MVADARCCECGGVVRPNGTTAGEPACRCNPPSIGEVIAAQAYPDSMLLRRADLTLTLRFKDAIALLAFYDRLVAEDPNAKNCR